MTYTPSITQAGPVANDATVWTYANDWRREYNEVRHASRWGITDTTDDQTTELQDMLDDLDALADGGTGAIVYLPNYDIYHASALDWKNLSNVIFLGPGGPNRNAAGLIYTGTAAGPIHDFDNSPGCVLNGVSLKYNQSGFTGVLARLGDPTSGVGTPTNSFEIQNAYIGAVDPTGSGYRTAGTLLAVDNAHNVALRNVRLEGAVDLVRGIADTHGSAGSNADDFANGILFDNVRFGSNYTTYAVRNPDYAWTFLNCSVGVNTSGACQFIDTDSGISPEGINIIGLQTSDASAAGNGVIRARGGGWQIIGGRMYYHNATFFVAMEQVDGVSILGGVHQGNSVSTFLLDFDTNAGASNSTQVFVSGLDLPGTWGNNLLVGSGQGTMPAEGIIQDTGTGKLQVISGTLLINPAQGIYGGTGTPEAVVTANKGSIFLRSDGGAGTGFYVKESGSSNTGWVAK